MTFIIFALIALICDLPILAVVLLMFAVLSA